MTLADLIKDFLDSTKERLKTPISGAFLWSFIVFNWRPIFLLLFSEVSIENKIIVINHEYCTFWALFWPVVIATFYTLLIPKIMLMIESDLAETADQRVTKRYEAQKHLVVQKRNVAKEEFLLKSDESGNQTIQGFNDQIKGLQEQNQVLQDSIRQINESNNQTIEKLNSTLKNSNETILVLQMESDRLKEEISNLKNSKVSKSDKKDRDISEILEQIHTGRSKLSDSSAKLLLRIVPTLTPEEWFFMNRVSVDKQRYIQSVDPADVDILGSLKAKGLISVVTIDGTAYHYFSGGGNIIYDILNDSLE